MTLMVDVAFARVKVLANRFVVVKAFAEYTFETEIIEGKSALTRARNKGGPADPMDGPANT